MTGIRSSSRLIPPLLAAALVALQGCSGFMADMGVGMPEQLQKNGVSAPAEILQIWDTGWTINDDPVIGMKVRVQPADRAAFEATIKKTAISRIAVPQFQPGNTLFVRYDPNDPSIIAVDSEGPSHAAVPSSGNPYRDRLVRATNLGAVHLPPPESPQLYLGTADSSADAQALYENDYVLIGGSSVQNAPDPRQAVEEGKELGAALVVVYGRFAPTPGVTLDVLPIRRRPQDPGEPAPNVAADAAPLALVSRLGPDDQVALYWAKTRPAILGIVSRPLTAREQADLGRTDGLYVESVANGSPAAAARIAVGDVVVAVDGKPVPDVRAVPAFFASFAGRRVTLDLIRGGREVSVTVQLNPASP